MLLVVAAACTRNVPGTTPPPGGASQKLDIASSGHLLVSASIDGRPYSLILDTGANITSLSTQAARELGIETSGSIETTTMSKTGCGTRRMMFIHRPVGKEKWNSEDSKRPKYKS
jgi:predicted aspartyl protease